MHEEQRAAEAEELALADGEVGAALVELCVEAAGQRGDGVGHLHLAQRRPQRRVAQRATGAERVEGENESEPESRSHSSRFRQSGALSKSIAFTLPDATTLPSMVGPSDGGLPFHTFVGYGCAYSKVDS